MKPAATPIHHPHLHVGVFACLWLAALCNAYLDIRYGTFGKEALTWGAIYAAALTFGWRQRHAPLESSARLRKIAGIVALLAFLFFMLPVWGLPRAFVYFLGALLAVAALGIRTRRNLHMLLLGSIAMMLFAVADFRADWSMGFYLLPYLFALIFTLAAEQLDRRHAAPGAQETGLELLDSWRILLGAALAILLIAAVLYSITPQWRLLGFSWQYGLPIPHLKGEPLQESPAGGIGKNSSVEGSAGLGQANPQPVHGAAGTSGYAQSLRKAAARSGMPQWQAFTMKQMADLDEILQQARERIEQTIDRLTQQIKQAFAKFAEHFNTREQILSTLLALLIAMLVLLREVRLGLWLRVRIDNWLHSTQRKREPEQQAIDLYRKMERLCDYYLNRRKSNQNTREYLHKLSGARNDLTRQLTRITAVFETASYHGRAPEKTQLDAANKAYLSLFHQLTL